MKKLFICASLISFMGGNAYSVELNNISDDEVTFTLEQTSHDVGSGKTVTIDATAEFQAMVEEAKTSGKTQYFNVTAQRKTPPRGTGICLITVKSDDTAEKLNKTVFTAKGDEGGRIQCIKS